MDTTPKYILMSEKAKEIQKKWKPKEGDFHCYIDAMCGHPIYTVKYSHLNDVHKTGAMKGHKCPLCRYDYDTFQEIMAIGRKDYDALTGWFVWLPRQDQLQKMVSICANYPCQTLSFLLQWKKKNKIMLSSFGSMEQLWLGFVMKEKYNKVWDKTKKEWAV